MRYQRLHKKIQGLTLLETLVSLTIITLTIIGPLAYITTSSSYAKQTKDIMTATYLAEEAIELLQNRYDSLYVFCLNQSGVSPCVTISGESSSEIAWRVFKEKLAAGDGYPSCYISTNIEGCSFDYIDMDADIAAFPPRYYPNDEECPTLVGVSSSTMYSYVCKGIPSHIQGNVSNVTFKRVLFLEHMPTFESSSWNEQDHDDIRITSQVSYRSANGVIRNVSIVRFLHRRS